MEKQRGGRDEPCLFPGGGEPAATMRWRRTRTMMIVRNCFVAKPGNASKLAAQLKEAAAVAQLPKHRVLTDVTGDFNRVVLEFEVENVAGFEARMTQYTTDETFREKMKGYTDLWVTGSREILRIA
jgi:hypothetical protein